MRIKALLFFLLIFGNASNIFAGIYSDNADGTVTDISVFLMWQKQDDGIIRTWENAISYCEGLALAGYTDWRVPNIKELSSLVDFNRSLPSISITYFPNTKSSNYWTSTTYSNDTASALLVYFGYGNTSGYIKTAQVSIEWVLLSNFYKLDFRKHTGQDFETEIFFIS